MFEERVGHVQTALFVRALLWGILAWAMSPFVLGTFFIVSFLVQSRDLAIVLTVISAILIGIGLVVAAAAAYIFFSRLPELDRQLDAKRQEWKAQYDEFKEAEAKVEADIARLEPLLPEFERRTQDYQDFANDTNSP